MGQFSSLSAIRGRRVLDAAGQHVGQIRDALLDLRDGRIEYICIELNAPGRAEPVEAVVPWSALRIDPDESRQWRVVAGRAVLEGIAQPILPRA